MTLSLNHLFLRGLRILDSFFSRPSVTHCHHLVSNAVLLYQLNQFFFHKVQEFKTQPTLVSQVTISLALSAFITALKAILCSLFPSEASSLEIVKRILVEIELWQVQLWRSTASEKVSSYNYRSRASTVTSRPLWTENLSPWDTYICDLFQSYKIRNFTGQALGLFAVCLVSLSFHCGRDAFNFCVKEKFFQLAKQPSYIRVEG